MPGGGGWDQARTVSKGGAEGGGDRHKAAGHPDTGGGGVHMLPRGHRGEDHKEAPALSEQTDNSVSAPAFPEERIKVPPPETRARPPHLPEAPGSLTDNVGSFDQGQQVVVLLVLSVLEPGPLVRHGQHLPQHLDVAQLVTQAGLPHRLFMMRHGSARMRLACPERADPT